MARKEDAAQKTDDYKKEEMNLEVEHTDRRERGFFTLVTIFTTRTIQRLLFVQRGEHAKDDRLAGL